jgi:hypothetical protein
MAVALWRLLEAAAPKLPILAALVRKNLAQTQMKRLLFN